MKTGTHLINEEYHITIPLQPITKKNSQRIIKKYNGKPFVVPSKQYKEYEEQCGIFLKELNIDYPINLKCIYYMETARKSDLANHLEATQDILVHYGVLTDDNATIVVSTDGSRMFYDRDNPRVEITITRTEPTFLPPPKNIRNRRPKHV